MLAILISIHIHGKKVWNCTKLATRGFPSKVHKSIPSTFQNVAHHGPPLLERLALITNGHRPCAVQAATSCKRFSKPDVSRLGHVVSSWWGNINHGGSILDEVQWIGGYIFSTNGDVHLVECRLSPGWVYVLVSYNWMMILIPQYVYI